VIATKAWVPHRDGDTPREKLAQLIAAIKQTIADHPLTNKTNFNARFNDFGESSLDILVYFYIETTDHCAELAAREEILLQMMDLAKDSGIEFAFPTRTLVIEGTLGGGSARGAGSDRRRPRPPLINGRGRPHDNSSAHPDGSV